MKYILLILALITFDAYANNHVRVVGTGKTFDEAKNNGFKTAVQYRVGMVLLSDRESRHSELTKNEISIYSSGYVDNFQIVSQRIVNNLYEVVMDVYVSDSKISRRLLSKNTSIQQFESVRHSEQINTMQQERLAGDKLLRQVLSDYPLKAYDIKQLPYQLKYDAYRNLQLFVPYEIKWNNNYVIALRELIENLQESRNQFDRPTPGNIYFVNREGYFEYKQQYQFEDLVRINAIREHFKNENEVRLKLQIKDGNGQVIGRKCYFPNFVVGRNKPMYSLGVPNTVWIWQSEIENNHVQFNLKYNGDMAKLAFYINEIELSISTDKDCGNN